MDELRTNDSRSNAAEFSVSELSLALKRTVEDAFGYVRVRGEISGYRGRHSSGHCYFSLKDERSRIEAVIWKGTFPRLKFQPQEGLEVVATGKLTTYPGSSKYQIVIDQLEPAGAGALMALLEERKRKLAAEGLFAEQRKKPLPFLPRVIGVVTSPTGAVIRDIIHRITDRFPLHVLVWPVRVQGETTGAEVSNAITGFNALGENPALPRPDVIIVARGGGSLEDLWGFNDEAVVRAVAASSIPIISAVGHETDWTLIDLAADCRAPTPTGAAEMASPVKADLEAELARLSARLKGAISRDLDRKRQAMRSVSRALPSPDQLFALPRRHFDECASRHVRALEMLMQKKRLRRNGVRLSPATLSLRLLESRRSLVQCGGRLPVVYQNLLHNRRTRLDRDAARISARGPLERMSLCAERVKTLSVRADRAITLRMEHSRAKLDHHERLAKSLSYQAVLDRGFALVRDSNDTPLKRAADIASGQVLHLQFADGTADAIATSQAAGPKPAPAQAGKSAPASKDKGGQGSLF